MRWLALGLAAAASVSAVAERLAAARQQHARALARLLAQHRQQVVAADEFDGVTDRYGEGLKRFARVRCAIQTVHCPYLHGLGTVVGMDGTKVKVTFDDAVKEWLVPERAKKLRAVLKEYGSLSIVHVVPTEAGRAVELAALLEVEVEVEVDLERTRYVVENVDGTKRALPDGKALYLYGFRDDEAGLQLYEEAAEAPYGAVEQKLEQSVVLPPGGPWRLDGLVWDGDGPPGKLVKVPAGGVGFTVRIQDSKIVGPKDEDFAVDQRPDLQQLLKAKASGQRITKIIKANGDEVTELSEYQWDLQQDDTAYLGESLSLVVAMRMDRDGVAHPLQNEASAFPTRVELRERGMPAGRPASASCCTERECFDAKMNALAVGGLTCGMGSCLGIFACCILTAGR